MYSTAKEASQALRFSVSALKDFCFVLALTLAAALFLAGNASAR